MFASVARVTPSSTDLVNRLQSISVNFGLRRTLPGILGSQPFLIVVITMIRALHPSATDFTHGRSLGYLRLSADIHRGSMAGGGGGGTFVPAGAAGGSRLLSGRKSSGEDSL